MNRRGFFGKAGGVLAGAVLALRTQPSAAETKRIGHIVDYVPYKHRIDGEYFFANSQAQEDELYEAVRVLARDGEQLFFAKEDGKGNIAECPPYGDDGALIFPSHGAGLPEIPLVRFACVVLLANTIFHPAFDAIRSKAERIP